MDDVIFDPAAALPRLGRLRAALAARDWAAVRRLTDEAGPVERTLLLLYAEPADPEGFLGHVLSLDPDDSTAAALLAQHRVRAAWDIRTGAPASRVSEEQFRGFEDGLQRAEWVLVEAAARRPEDPALWVIRLATTRGLGLGTAEARRRYDRLAAIDPGHLPGQRELLQSLCPKWGGSWPAATAFVQECVAAAAPGSLTPVLVVERCIEQWLELHQTDPAAGARYLREAAVQAEIHAAAQQSVWHPAFVPAPGWVRVLSTFALVYSEVGDQQAAAELFRRLGPLASEAPWTFFSSDPAGLVRQARAAAFAGAGAGQVRR